MRERMQELFRRVEGLVATSAMGPRGRASFTAAQRAFDDFASARDEASAAASLLVLANRALAAALDAHLAQLGAPASELPALLFDLGAAAREMERAARAPARDIALPLATRRTSAAPIVAPAGLGFAAPPPPPLIGPLATEAMVARETRAEPAVSVDPQGPSSGPVIQPPALVSVLGDYPLKRCAGLAASIARRSERRRAILEENDLTETTWQDVERHWAEAIKAGNDRGQTKLLSEYDEAYVAQLEAERGPILPEEFAKLMIAVERGAEKQALEDLDLPRGAIPRLQRVWLTKTLHDKTLARRVRAAMREQDC